MTAKKAIIISLIIGVVIVIANLLVALQWSGNEVIFFINWVMIGLARAVTRLLAFDDMMSAIIPGLVISILIYPVVGLLVILVRRIFRDSKEISPYWYFGLTTALFLAANTIAFIMLTN
ncbi:MAG: hypothetical protein WC980_03190 [Candidatus Brocadiia bacterium]